MSAIRPSPQELAIRTLSIGLKEGDGLYQGGRRLNQPEAESAIAIPDSSVVYRRGGEEVALSGPDDAVRLYHEIMARPSIPIATTYGLGEPLQYRHASTEHFDTFEALDRLCFQFPYPPDTLRHYITEPGTEAVIATAKPGAIGYYVLAHGAGAPTSSNLDIIGVTPQAQGKKAGELLLLEVMQAARAHGSAQCYLEVDVKNVGAQKLYRKYDFQTVETINDWISPGRQAYRMRFDHLQTPETGHRLEKWQTDLAATLQGMPSQHYAFSNSAILPK